MKGRVFLYTATDFWSEFIHLFCPYKMDTWIPVPSSTVPNPKPSHHSQRIHGIVPGHSPAESVIPEQAPMTRCAVGKAREMTPSPLGGMEGRKPSHDFWSQVSHENNLLAFHYTGCSIWIIIMVYIYIWFIVIPTWLCSIMPYIH